MAKAKQVLEESIRELYEALKPKCLMLADMGCGSGPNALLVVSEIMEAMNEACRNLNRPMLEFGVFLNDLPGNDFNALFLQFLPSFYKQIEEGDGCNFGPCFVSATPKSFYGRVFPSQFLHFVHSSFSLHWLSQVNYLSKCRHMYKVKVVYIWISPNPIKTGLILKIVVGCTYCSYYFFVFDNILLDINF